MHRHAQEFLFGIAQHDTGRLVGVEDLRLRIDPIDCIHCLVHRELSTQETHLALFAISDIMSGTDQMRQLTVSSTNGMASDLGPDDRPVFPDHAQFIVVLVGFAAHDSLPVGHRNELVIRMHQIQPDKRIG